MVEIRNNPIPKPSGDIKVLSNFMRCVISELVDYWQCLADLTQTAKIEKMNSGKTFIKRLQKTIQTICEIKFQKKILNKFITLYNYVYYILAGFLTSVGVVDA